MTTLYDAQILSEPGLACFLPLSDAAGGATCADASGAGFTGTVHGTGVGLGAASLLTADTETACSFDGTNSYISVASLGIASGPWAVELWLDCAGMGSLPGGANYDALVAVNDSQRILYNPENRDFLVQNGGVNFFSAQTYPNNTILYLAYVWDGALQSLYLDGLLDSAATPDSAPTWDGAWNIGEDVFNGQYAWNGRLAKVAFYTAALSPAQIALHAALGRDHVTPLVARVRDGKLALHTRDGAITLKAR